MSNNNYGWICPKCEKVLAPWCPSCDCSTQSSADQVLTESLAGVQEALDKPKAVPHPHSSISDYWSKITPRNDYIPYPEE
jgi:hypothetical protein